MSSGAIIHEENFHECMALNNTATLNSANFHKEFVKIFPLENNLLYKLYGININVFFAYFKHCISESSSAWRQVASYTSPINRGP